LSAVPFVFIAGRSFEKKKKRLQRRPVALLGAAGQAWVGELSSARIAMARRRKRMNEFWKA
jgi:hypothetical protein